MLSQRPWPNGSYLRQSVIDQGSPSCSALRQGNSEHLRRTKRGSNSVSD